jgi:hypothetical protein
MSSAFYVYGAWHSPNTRSASKNNRMAFYEEFTPHIEQTGVYRHFQQYFSYIVVVSFIIGRNRIIRKKPTEFVI